MTLLKTIYILGGLLLILLSIPLILRKIRPNPWYGFRIRWTLEDPELWYSVNAYTGKWLVFVGLCAILGAIGLALIPEISLDAYAFGNLGIFAASFILSIIQSMRFLRTLDNQK
ncbi:MAG: SdpI family protein [Anaerolineales bacterium]|nr:SdpI family protein [Anaerolineales bacterium]